ncbi:MAG: hypothetical protein M1834_003817 [Cirrosporium novae-zelandiae]|nr:MAG: hypothetical protein M1834_003817 [Cirrosporium novae-zelandiae]
MAQSPPSQPPNSPTVKPTPDSSGQGSSASSRTTSPRRGIQRVTFDVDRGRSKSASPSPTSLAERSPSNSHSRLRPASSLRLPVDRRSHRLDANMTEYAADITDIPTPFRSRSPTSFRLDEVPEDVDESIEEKQGSQASAQERARQLASLLGSSSAPASCRNSSDTLISPSSHSPKMPAIDDGIALTDLSRHNTADDDEGTSKPTSYGRSTNTAEAHSLVRNMTQGKGTLNPLVRVRASPSGLQSGRVTPEAEKDPDDYVERPAQYRGNVLSSLLKLYHQQEMSQMASSQNGSNIPTPHSYHSHGRSLGRPISMGDLKDGLTPVSSRGSSGVNTPRHPRQPKWYDKSGNQSVSSLAGLINTSTMIAPGSHLGGTPPARGKRPGMPPRSRSGGIINAAMQKVKPRLEDEIRITVHIAAILSRQKYLIKLCRALMRYGAPTHRLEEYLRMTARVLEIESQFLYIPGCMIISFDDSSTHTTEVRLVKEIQGVDLGRLRDVHEIYKEVVHDVIGVEEATQRLDEVWTRKEKHTAWIRVIVYGFASVFVGPFAFGGRPIDFPPAFLLGCILGILQLIAAPKSELYSNVFEISAAVFTSFLARAFGSIQYSDGTRVFCFAALAQSSIALILPGYVILCGSLELQSRSIVAGSVRMVYAIIYSLFLGFGITIGTVIYGLMDSNATSSTTCPTSPVSTYFNFLWVALFALCLAIINQAKWKQTPIMLFISLVGYTVNFFSTRLFSSNTQVSNAIAAFAIGVVANLYSRFRHGVAAAALLPAIFVQVPSGLAATGSLVSGITSANQITQNTTGITVSSNSTTLITESNTSAIWAVGYGMVQIAIGITVGLFISALVVYPFGKRRSGLFSF